MYEQQGGWRFKGRRVLGDSFVSVGSWALSYYTVTSKPFPYCDVLRLRPEGVGCDVAGPSDEDHEGLGGMADVNGVATTGQGDRGAGVSFRSPCALRHRTERRSSSCGGNPGAIPVSRLLLPPRPPSARPEDVGNPISNLSSLNLQESFHTAVRSDATRKSTPYDRQSIQDSKGCEMS